MFSVKHNECVGFESKWKVTKVSTNSTTQTTEFSVKEIGCTTTEKTSKLVQTDLLPEPSEVADMDKLAKWLNSIYPKVKKQLDKANSSKVFRNYRLMEDSIDVTCKLLQTVQVNVREEGSKAIPVVSNLQWNNSRSALTMACSYKHKTWCHHSGEVSVYQVTREQKLSPRKRLTCESCVTSTKFHPLQGNILAAGTFTGHVYIWNIDNDLDPLICDVVAHDEYVTHVTWTSDVNSPKTILLATASTDGLVKIWNFDLSPGVLRLKVVYKIKTPILGRINQTTEISKSVLEKGDLGVVCFDFSPHLPDVFIVGLEGGLVVRCSVLGANRTKSIDDQSCFDPVFKYYEPHGGEIVSAKCCPHNKELFLTSGTDGEIRIYHLDQDDPAQVIFTKSPLNDLSFVLHEPQLLVGCGLGGTLEIYHLVQGNSVSLTFSETVSKQTLTSVAVKGDWAAVGGQGGQVQLWAVPWRNIWLQNSPQ